MKSIGTMQLMVDFVMDTEDASQASMMYGVLADIIAKTITLAVDHAVKCGLNASDFNLTINDQPVNLDGYRDHADANPIPVSMTVH